MLYLLEVLSILLLVLLIYLVTKHVGLCVGVSKTRKKHDEEIKKLKDEISGLQELIKSYQKNERFLLEELQKTQEGEYKSI